MKKYFIASALILTALQASAQLKIVKFGAKAGINYPQSSLSLEDINTLINDQTYDISQIQTDISNGFNGGLIARVSLPLIPAYVHGEALYTQFKEEINMIDGGTNVDISNVVRRLDFPISAGAKFGPAFAGLGATPSIPLSNANAIWSNDSEANFTWGWHIHAGVKLWKILAELKYESGFGLLARDVNYNYNNTDYNFSLDARRSQLIVSLGYFFD